MALGEFFDDENEQADEVPDDFGGGAAAADEPLPPGTPRMERARKEVFVLVAGQEATSGTSATMDRCSMLTPYGDCSTRPDSTPC